MVLTWRLSLVLFITIAFTLNLTLAEQEEAVVESQTSENSDLQSSEIVQDPISYLPEDTAKDSDKESDLNKETFDSATEQSQGTSEIESAVRVDTDGGNSTANATTEPKQSPKKVVCTLNKGLNTTEVSKSIFSVKTGFFKIKRNMFTGSPGCRRERSRSPQRNGSFNEDSQPVRQQCHKPVDARRLLRRHVLRPVVSLFG